MLMSGFADPVIDAQSAFRSVMDAFAHPGRIVTLAAPVEGPQPLMPGTAAIALTLFDHDSPVWIDAPGTRETIEWLRFHTAAPVVTDPKTCAFAIVTDGQGLRPFGQFNLGSDDYPDRSTTIVLQVKTLTRGRMMQLSGPGIETQRAIAPDPVPLDMHERLFANRALFPRGVDLLLVCGDDIVAIPRSVRVAGDS